MAKQASKRTTLCLDRNLHPLSRMSTGRIISLYRLYVICNLTVYCEGFKAVTLKTTALWQVTSCSLVLYINTGAPSNFMIRLPKAQQNKNCCSNIRTLIVMSKSAC
jgi:hypothetical protein